MPWLYRDFPRFFSKMHRDFADFLSFYRDFLTALVMTHVASRRMVYDAAYCWLVAIDVVCGGQRCVLRKRLYRELVGLRCKTRVIGRGPDHCREIQTTRSISCQTAAIPMTKSDKIIHSLQAHSDGSFCQLCCSWQDFNWRSAVRCFCDQLTTELC